MEDAVTQSIGEKFWCWSGCWSRRRRPGGPAAVDDAESVALAECWQGRPGLAAAVPAQGRHAGTLCDGRRWASAQFD